MADTYSRGCRAQRRATTCNDVQRRATTCNDVQRRATTCNDIALLWIFDRQDRFTAQSPGPTKSEGAQLLLERARSALAGLKVALPVVRGGSVVFMTRTG
ncbi:hypothetical protein ACIQ6K_30500 [Streptomyces sp. NPDC096354]|uniref:hypothetical protein n=1 Tax=Streptomyces sp. NPDC096354 TaxID=3366088 RepID=UPI00380F695C